MYFLHIASNPLWDKAGLHQKGHSLRCCNWETQKYYRSRKIGLVFPVTEPSRGRQQSGLSGQLCSTNWPHFVLSCVVQAASPPYPHLSVPAKRKRGARKRSTSLVQWSEGGLQKWHTLPRWPPIGKNLVAWLHLASGSAGNHVSSWMILYLAKTSGNFVLKEREDILKDNLHSLPQGIHAHLCVWINEHRESSLQNMESNNVIAK